VAGVRTAAEVVAAGAEAATVVVAVAVDAAATAAADGRSSTADKVIQ
jgi:hypothetical protein